jgi:hypothetical protein
MNEDLRRPRTLLAPLMPAFSTPALHKHRVALVAVPAYTLSWFAVDSLDRRHHLGLTEIPLLASTTVSRTGSTELVSAVLAVSPDCWINVSLAFMTCTLTASRHHHLYAGHWALLEYVQQWIRREIILCVKLLLTSRFQGHWLRHIV